MITTLSMLLSFVCGIAEYSEASDIVFFGIVLSCLSIVLGIIFGKFFIGLIVTFIPTAIIGIIGFYKLRIAGVPFSFADFYLIGQSLNIAKLNKDSISFTPMVGLIAICAIASCVLFYFADKKLGFSKKSIKAKLISAVAFILVFVIVQPFTPAYGSMLNLWVEAMPKLGLFEEEIDTAELLANISDETVVPYEKKPNVIMILSESFFDVTKLAGVNYASDPVKEFHDLQKESIYGKFYTRTLGYGTCDIEMEILTGMNTSYLGKDLHLSEMDLNTLALNDSVPKLYKNDGYETVYIHSFNDQIYNRSRFLPTVGFNNIYFSGDLNELLYPEFNLTKSEYYYQLSVDYLEKEYYSDMLIADSVIKVCENTDDPVFCFAATMANHTPFGADKYYEYDYEFTTDVELNEEAIASINPLTQGVANASKMLGQLTDYFRESEEPTIIIFFGDHKPNIPISNDSNLYMELGLINSTINRWTDEEKEVMLSTDYLIWANDAAYLDAEQGTKKDETVNFMGLDI
ncbi:MAG: sulfatase-like hydrolase/transferase [Clostridia bacterium]|nr:sulfatase-like hydrolase/transferase [Clostridia bacterium]